ncbi:GNAT family N-acetyltransferase [Streptomyces sp. SID4919]|uniref:GNAT family N-acetyltransferase n=1 Tax=unclassified Streptomyces TaxID=2593676 RepID=UPI000823CC16|nr:MULTISPECIES: GNAT family N-acetyltransferase [unclassified Streptomyces]MYY12800.1 GNAT family N-acetyltransferase [Streptomyces sp. SID4919]SCK61621.1 Protein N-acetyltransferase, RimJ/RimL family [Streptomyces sp. AmelKG-E11A]
MPSLVNDVVAAGTLARVPQPSMEVEGGLVARPWADHDASAVFTAFQDPTLHQWHVRSADSPDEVLRWIADWRAAWAGERGAYWAVADAHSDELVGRVALRSMVLGDGLAEVAYWTVPSARGRGVAPRAVRALSRWAFGIGFHRLELMHAIGNDASCRVAAKSGFVEEGTKRSAALHQDGWYDMHLHARVAGDPV